MTTEFAANLAAVVLPIACLGLLLAIGMLLDFGATESVDLDMPAGGARHRAAPSSQRAEWAEDFKAVRAEIARQKAARRERHEADEDWTFNTKEWNRKLMDFCGQPTEATVSAQRGAR